MPNYILKPFAVPVPGQHANKTATKVELSFEVDASEGLSEEEKARIHKRLSNRITKEGMLKMQCEESRSQHTNRELVTESFFKGNPGRT